MMTPRQRRFVAEFLIDPNGTQAAIRAGYSAKTARAIAHENLTKPYIAAAIQEGQSKLAKRLEVSAEMVVAELAKIGFANVADYMRFTKDGVAEVNLSKLTHEQSAAIQEVVVEEFLEGRGEDAKKCRRIKFKLADKRAALVDLGKHLGLFKDGGSGSPTSEPIGQIEIVIVDPGGPGSLHPLPGNE